jgi:hypothetical protein
MTVSVLTQHNNNIRSGANLQETTLNTSNVNVNEFGQVAARDVIGHIYAQPLYAPAVPVSGATRNMVIVATMENWVYAFDADDLSPGAGPLWKKHLNPHPVPSKFYADGKYVDIVDNGNIGILSTPAIDLAARTIYVVAATYEPATLNGQHPQQAFKQLLFALNLSTGNLRRAAAGSTNPVEITGSVAGPGYGRTVTTRVGGKQLSFTEPTGGRVVFTPVQHMQRPGLLLEHGLLYIAFGSHGDIDPYHGWVFAYDAATLKQRGVFCATPHGAKAGVWQAGEGLVADGNGNLYFGSGNGDSEPNGAPIPASGPNLGESFIRLHTGAASLDLDAFVTVIQDSTNPVFDEDLGAASPTILPDGFLVGGGKDGNLYLLDPSQLTNGGAQAAVVQKFLATRGPGSRARPNNDETHHIHGSPVVYDSPNHGVLVYVWGENNVVRAYGYDPATHRFPNQPNQRNKDGNSLAHGTLFASNDIRDRTGMPGAMLSLTANGQTAGTAILWASFPPFLDANHQLVDGELVAYDATQFDAQGRMVLLWRSHQNPVQDDVGKFPKFCCPTIADGKVFHATFSNKLRMYGLRPTPDGGYHLDFGGRTALTLNGSARSNGGPLRLAGQHDLQAGSVFCTQPVDVRKFTTTFRFQITGAQKADGFTFCVQSEGPRALGGPGGGLGYGPDPSDPNDPGFKVTRSVALKFDLVDEATAPHGSMAVYRDGASPTAAHALTGEIGLDALGINLQSGHPFNVTMAYATGTLTVTIADDAAPVERTMSFPIDIPSITGNIAHVGFTAGTGFLSANHDILDWQFSP